MQHARHYIRKRIGNQKNSVLNKLQRIAKLDIKDVDILTNAEYYYRNKVDLKVENGQLGYYNRKTHNLTQISTCKIASKAINQMINWLENQNLNGVSEIKIDPITTTKSKSPWIIYQMKC